MHHAFRHIYVSIPFYDHEVFKCAGMVPVEQVDFYVPRFEQGIEMVSALGPEPKRVLVLDHAPADRVTFVAERAETPTSPLTYRDSGILFLKCARTREQGGSQC